MTKTTLTILFSILAVLGQNVHTKMVVKTFGTNIYLVDQAPIYESKIALLNDGTNSLSDFQIAIPTTQIPLIGSLQAEDGFGNALKTSINDEKINDPFIDSFGCFSSI